MGNLSPSPSCNVDCKGQSRGTIATTDAKQLRDEPRSDLAGSRRAGRRLGLSWTPLAAHFPTLGSNNSPGPEERAHQWAHMGPPALGQAHSRRQGQRGAGWHQARDWTLARGGGPSSSLPGRRKKMKLKTPQQAAFWTFSRRREKKKGQGVQNLKWALGCGGGVAHLCLSGPLWGWCKRSPVESVMFHALKIPNSVTWRWPESHDCTCWLKRETPTPHCAGPPAGTAQHGPGAPSTPHTLLQALTLRLPSPSASPIPHSTCPRDSPL